MVQVCRPHPTPPQRVWVHRGLYVQGGLVCYKWSSPRPPLWVGGACLYVDACMGVCMYLYVSMYVCIYSMPRPPLWVGGACLYVHACMGVCMYLSVSMYVCMYSLCVYMYIYNACCEVSLQTNILFLSLLLDGPNPFGGGGATKPDIGIIYIYLFYFIISFLFFFLGYKYIYLIIDKRK